MFGEGRSVVERDLAEETEPCSGEILRIRQGTNGRVVRHKFGH